MRSTPGGHYITSVEDNIHAPGGHLQAGMPVTIDFENEFKFSQGMAEPGTLSTSPAELFRTFGVAADGHYLDLCPIRAGRQGPNFIRLQDDVRNA